MITVSSSENDCDNSDSSKPAKIRAPASPRMPPESAGAQIETVFDATSSDSPVAAVFLIDSDLHTPLPTLSAPAPASSSAPASRRRRRRRPRRCGRGATTWLMGSPDPSDQERDLYHRTPLSSMVRIGLPPTISYLAAGLMVFADRLVVGKFLDDRALAALSYASAIDPIVKSIGSATSIGGSQHISGALGTGSVAEAERALGMSLFGSLVFSILGTAILVPLLPLLLSVSGTPSDLTALATAYSLPLILGCILTVMQRSLSGLLLAEGRANLSMTVNVLNTVLNTVAGFGLVAAGAGIAGAAWASIIAAATTTVIMLGLYACGATSARLRLRLCVPRNRADWRLLGSIVAIGAGDVVSCLASGVVSISINAVLSAVLSVENGYSEEEFMAGMSAIGVVTTIFGITEEIFAGFCSAGLVPLLSFADGRKDRGRFMAVLKVNVISSTLLALFLTILIEIFAPHIAGMFDDGTIYLEMATGALRVSFASTVIVPAQFYMISAAQALGSGDKYGRQLCARATFVSFMCYCLLLPLAYVALGLTTGEFYLCQIAFIINDVLSGITSISLLIKPIVLATKYVAEAPVLSVI